MSRRFSRRDFVRGSLLGVGAAILASCVPAEPQQGTPVAGDTPAPDETPQDGVPEGEPTPAEALPQDVQGDISISYWGDIATYEENWQDNAAWGAAYLLIKDWIEQHPNVNIEWVSVPGPDRIDVYRTQLIAGTMTDLVASYPDGPIIEGNVDLLYEFTPDLQQPNPYGTEPTWEDELPLGSGIFQFDSVHIPEDERYFIGNTSTGNLGQTVYFYNVDMFEDAGIERVPETWTELMEASRMLQEAGYEPYFTGEMQMDWDLRWMPEQLLDPVLNDILAVWEERALTQEIATWAVTTGVLRADDPRYLDVMRLLKDFSQYWIDDWRAPEEVDYLLTQRVAMIQNGFWALSNYRDSPAREFEFGTFYLPEIDPEASEYATGAERRRTGTTEGGLVATSFMVPLTTIDRGTYPIVRDLLHFLTARSTNEQWCDMQYPPCVPPGGSIEDVVTDPVELQQLYGFYNPQMTEDTNQRNLDQLPANDTRMRLFQEYLLDRITLEDVGEQLQAEWEREAEQNIINNPEWNVDEWPEP